jgi:hypothetical protein
MSRASTLKSVPSLSLMLSGLAATEQPRGDADREDWIAWGDRADSEGGHLAPQPSQGGGIVLLDSGGRRRRIAAGLALGLFAACGCATVRPSESGFLTDYSGLEASRVKLHKRAGLKREKGTPTPAEDLARVDSFYIAPVAWLVSEHAAAGKDESTRDRVVRAFDESLREELGKVHPVVYTPGPNSAIIRPAVTDVVRARPLSNAALTVVAVPLFNGGGAFEVEAVDAAGRQLAAISTSSSGGALEFLSYFSRSRQACDAARRAAADFRSRIESPQNDPSD